MRVIAVLNQKGGVGKTSICHHVGGALAAAGQNVVLIDNDPQASLTQGFLGPEATEALDPASTIAAVYDAAPHHLDALVTPTGLDRVALVRGSWRLGDHNLSRPTAAPWELQEALRSLREDLDDAPPGAVADIALVDCPPNLHLLAWAAVAAADLVVVPVQAEDYGSQGIAAVERFIRLVRQTNPGLPDPVFAVNLFDRRCSLPRLYETEIRASYGARVLRTVLPRSVDFPEAVSRRLNAQLWRPKGQAAAATRSLADELLERLAGDTPAPAHHVNKAEVTP